MGTKRLPLVDAVNLQPPPPVPRFFDSYFPAVQEIVNADRLKVQTAASSQIAEEDVHPKAEGEGLSIADFNEREFDIAAFKRYAIVNAEQGRNIALGESVDGNAQFDLVAAIFNAANVIRERFGRAIERQAMEALLDGVTQIRGQNTTADFGRHASHNFTLDWSTDAATILTDLRGMCDAVKTRGLVEPQRVIMGRDVLERLDQNALLDKLLLQRGRDDIQATTQILNGGQVFKGILPVTVYRLELYAINNYFTDQTTGNITPYFPNNRVLVLPATMLRNARYYASNPTIQPANPQMVSLLGLDRVPSVNTRNPIDVSLTTDEFQKTLRVYLQMRTIPVVLGPEPDGSGNCYHELMDAEITITLKALSTCGWKGRVYEAGQMFKAPQKVAQNFIKAGAAQRITPLQAEEKEAAGEKKRSAKKGR